MSSTPKPRRERPPLYDAEQRARRDRTVWTTVQAVLAPLQFLASAVSLVLVLCRRATGSRYEAATWSILVKRGFLHSRGFSTVAPTSTGWARRRPMC